MRSQGKGAGPSCLVIVVDDSLRFGLHVWRYLGRSVGFGIGRATVHPQADKGLGGEPGAGESKSSTEWLDKVRTSGAAQLKTPLERVEVAWIRLEQRVEDVKQRVFSCLEDAEKGGVIKDVVLILDVHVEGSGQDERSTNSPLSLVKLLLERLSEGGWIQTEECGTFEEYSKAGSAASNRLQRRLRIRSEAIFVVSSLAIPNGEAEALPTGGNGPGVSILPKAPSTLQEIDQYVQGLLRASADRVSRKSRAIHVLVTGAGFEYPSWGEGVQNFGVPGIGKVLGHMRRPFFAPERIPQQGPYVMLKQANGSDSDLPSVEVECHTLNPGIKTETLSEHAAKVAGLDGWWTWVLQRTRALLPEMEPRDTLRDEERRLREAFRSVFLRYDYGQLLQALCAAQLDWTVWLTTNYTRFAERAVASSDYWGQESESRSGKVSREERCPDSLLFPVLKGSGAAKKSFRTVDTSQEAIFLTRELEAQSAQSVIERNRFLFKLHGDITHLRTMAIAGEDKEAFSQLSLPVDDLHLVYASAASLLSRYLQELRALEKETFASNELVWHIVGHGLQDKALIALLGRVRSAVPELRMVFRIIQPQGDNSRRAKVLLEVGLASALGYVRETLRESPSWDELPEDVRSRNEVQIIDSTAERYILELAQASQSGEIPEFDAPPAGRRGP